GANAERLPAVASNGTSTLVAWFEVTHGRTILRAGISGADRSWLELGKLAVTEAESAISASDGSNYLIAWGKSAMRIDSSGAILLDRDLRPRGEVTLVPDTSTDTAVAWNGSEYLAIICRNSTVLASRVSRDGVLRDPIPRLIHDHGELNTPVSPTIIATGNG